MTLAGACPGLLSLSVPFLAPIRSMSETPSNPLTDVNRSPGRTPDKKDATGVATAADARLMEGVRAGDQQAMAEIFDRYGRMVYSVALRVLQDPGHAEDVMQDVLFKVWREPTVVSEGRGSLGAWLAVMARNRAIDALRRRKPTDAVEDVVLVSKTNISSEYRAEFDDRKGPGSFEEPAD